MIISITIVYLKHQTLFEDPFMKSQCFVRSKFWPWSFGDTKIRKLIFIPKKQWLLNCSLFYIRLVNFIWFDQHFWELCFVEISVLKTGRIFVPYETLTKTFYNHTKTYQSSKYALSTKYYNAVILSRISSMELENQKPCFVRFRVKFVRNTH